MKINPVAYVILGIASTVIAQITLKRATGVDAFKIKWFILTSSSLVFYAISFLSYFFALKTYDISTVQPIMMSSIVALISIYGYLSGETMNLFKIAGLALTVISIVLIAKS